jgi:hypothetical protein
MHMMWKLQEKHQIIADGKGDNYKRLKLLLYLNNRTTHSTTFASFQQTHQTNSGCHEDRVCFQDGTAH